MKMQKKRTRRAALEEQREFQADHEERQLASWLASHDLDGDGALDRAEFAALVRSLGDGEDADRDTVGDDAIDKLFAKARSGKDTLTLTKSEIREAVLRYREYLMHHDYLDSIMSQFDTDGNGSLDRGEVKRMLETILRDGAKLTMNTEGREYKLKALEAAYEKGLLDKQAYMAKLYKVQGRKPSGCEAKWVAVTDDDVDFVIAQADTNGDGLLDRDEVLASLALWTKLLKGAEEKDNLKASALCSLM